MIRFPAMRGGRSLSAVAMLLLVGAARADETAQKLYAPCAACHGEKGVSQTENVPSLAGQPDYFLQWQLLFFRLGRRQNEIMQPIASALDNEAIRALGAYIAAMPGAPPPRRDASDLLEKGRRLAMENKCGVCHGEKFEGAGAAARLAGQREDYVLKALQDFKSGKRIGGGVSSMPDALYGVDEKDLPALAHFVTAAQQ